MPTEDWICRVCGTKTAASSNVCAGCGARTFAQGAELAAFAAGHAPMVATTKTSPWRGTPSEPEAQSAVQRFLNSHLWVKRGIAVVLFVLAACGATVFWVSRDLIYIALGIAAVALAYFVGFVLGIELHFEKRKSRPSESSPK
jgi:hypothetical protein